MKLSLSTISTVVGLTVTVAGAVTGVLAWHKSQIKKEFSRGVTEHVMPALQSINNRLDSLATKNQIKSLYGTIDSLGVNNEILKDDVNRLYRYNREALDELRKQREIDALTMRKAAAYDDIKKNEIQ